MSSSQQQPQPQQPPIDNALVLNSAINHHIFSHNRHHVANMKHIMNTNNRITNTITKSGQDIDKVESEMRDVSMDLDSYVDVLSICTTVSKKSMTRARLIINDAVAKEKLKEKYELKAKS